MRDTGIADRLRARGLKVVEVAGWQTRGSADFDPLGSVDHHTAGAAKGNAPSLRICIEGRSDLPGPLCHVLVARDNTCIVIAAGRANHAGDGTWKGLSGNSSVYGVERENVGTSAEPWRADQTDTAAIVHAALVDRPGLRRPDLVCLHREWAPKRKVDAHSISGDQLRLAVAQQLHSPPTSEDDDVTRMVIQPEPGHPGAAGQWLAEGLWRRHITHPAHSAQLQALYGPARIVPGWLFDMHADISLVESTTLAVGLQVVPALAELVGRPLADVDEAAIAAAVLAGLSAEVIADAMSDGLAAEVADVLAERLAA